MRLISRKNEITADVNAEVSTPYLVPEKGAAIREACDEIMAGKWPDEFPLVVYPVSYTHLDVYKRQHHGNGRV